MDLVSRKAVLSLLHGITMSPEDAALFSQVFKYMEEQIKALPRWDGEKELKLRLMKFILEDEVEDDKG